MVWAVGDGVVGVVGGGAVGGGVVGIVGVADVAVVRVVVAGGSVGVVVTIAAAAVVDDGGGGNAVCVCNRALLCECQMHCQWWCCCMKLDDTEYMYQHNAQAHSSGAQNTACLGTAAAAHLHLCKGRHDLEYRYPEQRPSS